jgi:Xaa-Pro dipeptidase
MDLATLYRQHVTKVSAGTAAALEKAGYNALLIHSGRPLKRTEADDQYWSLRPTPHFQHWLPLAEPHCAVLAVPGRKPKLLRAEHESYWEMLPEPESEHFWGEFEVAGQARRSELPQGRIAFIGDDARAARELGIDDVNPPELLRALDELRVHKTEYELYCLAKANARAAKGHDELRRLFAEADHSELELHLSYLGRTLQDDTDTPYKNIVALGKHAATLHHITYEKRAQPALSMLVDAGAAFCGYGSDVTRTWVKGGGEAGSIFAHIVSSMEAMQQRLCAMVRPGVSYESLHDESHRQVAAIIREAGLSRLSEEELLAKKVTRAFYPHGLGHSLGLQVHDVGCGLIPPRADNPWLRNTSTISIGQVFTIEPGFYFIDALLQPVLAAGDVDWTLVEALAPFGGVRIEDDLHVGAAGVRNLTREVLPHGGGKA